MNTRTALSLKKDLLEKKSHLQALQTSNSKLEIDLEGSKDLIDRSDSEEAWFNKERFHQHWTLELRQINHALQKIEMGNFGICIECDEEIPLKRLRVRPDASYCLNCQEAFERENRKVSNDSNSALLN